jgi:hypothetical protein
MPPAPPAATGVTRLGNIYAAVAGVKRSPRTTSSALIAKARSAPGMAPIESLRSATAGPVAWPNCGASSPAVAACRSWRGNWGTAPPATGGQRDRERGALRSAAGAPAHSVGIRCRRPPGLSAGAAAYRAPVRFVAVFVGAFFVGAFLGSLPPRSPARLSGAPQLSFCRPPLPLGGRHATACGSTPGTPLRQRLHRVSGTRRHAVADPAPKLCDALLQSRPPAFEADSRGLQ